MKKKKAKKPKKRKNAAKSSRRRRSARVRPIVGPFQIELPLQMPLFPLSSPVVEPPAPVAADAPAADAPAADDPADGDGGDDEGAGSTDDA